MQKSVNLNPLTLMLASSLLFGSYLALKADGQVTDSKLKSSPATVNFVAQNSTYPTIEADEWLNPLAELPVNTPILLRRGTNTPYLAVLSKDTLNPPPQIIEIPPPQGTLVTQWSRNELRVYGYETRNTESTEIIEPTRVNQGLFPISRRTIACGRALLCSVQVGSPAFRTVRALQLVPNPDGSMRTEYAQNHEIRVFVGSKTFTLVGWEGIFPIDASLATALQQASATIKIVTPSGWEATINQRAVESLHTVYQ